MSEPKYQCPVCRFVSNSEELMKHIRSMHSESESPLPNFDMDKWYDIMTKDHHTEYS